jgi:transcription elongation GreA/GreB family factor
MNTGLFTSDDLIADSAVNAKLDPQVRALLDAGNQTGVEELFLSRIDAGPLDPHFFIPIIRHFVRNKNFETADTLLQFLLDAATASGNTELERSFLRALLAVWPDSRFVRDIVFTRLASLYADAPSLQKLMDHFKVREAVDPVAACKKIESWLRFDVGQGVYMAKKGTGRVREINVSLNAIRVVFSSSSDPVSFKPDEAERLLLRLSPGHLLLDILDRIDEVKNLAASDGKELLRRLFTSMDRPLSLTEVKDLLAGVVPPQQWSAWWSQVKQDRRLTVNSANRCSWNDSADDADSAIIKEFETAAPRVQLDMAKQYGKRSPLLVKAMVPNLLATAQKSADGDPSLALEIYLSIERLNGNDAASLSGMSVALLTRNDPALLVSGIQDRMLRKRALTLIKDNRGDWAVVFERLLKSESDASALTYLYDALSAGGFRQHLDGLIVETLSNPIAAPDFFVWLLRSMMEREELERYRSWSLVQTLMTVLTRDTIKQHNAALRKLFDENGLVDSVARKQDSGTAAQFLTLLERDSALEEYRRERIIKELRAFLSPAVKNEDKLFYVTPQSLSQRLEEFRKITTIDIPQNTEEIIKARAHGDLRENFEYHAARARQELLSSRAKTLHDELQFARPIDFSKIDTTTVCIGTNVSLKPLENDVPVQISILGPWDSNPERNIFSYQARIAEGLLGKKKGDSVLFHDHRYSIDAIAVWDSSIP